MTFVSAGLPCTNVLVAFMVLSTRFPSPQSIWMEVLSSVAPMENPMADSLLVVSEITGSTSLFSAHAPMTISDISHAISNRFFIIEMY